MCSDQENHKQKSSKPLVGLRRKAAGEGCADTLGPTRRGPLRTTAASGEVKTKSTEEAETYRVQDG